MNQAKFACPDCGDFLSDVINCRPGAKPGTVFRRRRRCRSCGHRFTTVETIAQRQTTKHYKKPAAYNI
jgi:transcriptional regulator NrdR family protein